MTRCTRILFILFAISSTLLFATDVSANFRNNFPSYYWFNTDMRLTTDLLVSSNGIGLNNGDSVCDGATITVKPSTTTKWAVSSLDVVSLYGCNPEPSCIAMTNAGSSSMNKDVQWLSPSVYQENLNAGSYVQDYNDATVKKLYGELQVFYNEPVGYVVFPGKPANMSKEAGVNVFCKGQLVIRDGSNVISTTDMPSSAQASFTISSSGTHQITTSLEGVSCFGAVVQHPLYTSGPNMKNFVMSYYTQNAPSFASSAGLQITSLNVKTGTPNCKLSQSEFDITSVNTGLSMVHVTVKNDGDPVTMDSVSSSDAGFDASPFPISLCGTYGLPSSVCPSSNGFNEVIPTGGSKDIYVLLQNNGGHGTVLTFTSKVAPSSGSCGGGTTGATCPLTVDLSNQGGPTFCQITPTSLAYGTREVARFDVACYDLGHNPVPCTGDDWLWNGISGDFIEKDNTHALAYPTSDPGASGTLEYQSSTGNADCTANIDVITPTYVCAFTPPSANLKYSQSQPFVLGCQVGGTDTTPDSTTYGTHDGLQGTLTNQTNSGVTYTAPDSDTSGKLTGFGEFNSAPSPLLGAVAEAPITVSSGAGAASCTIEPKSLTYGTREVAQFDVACEDSDLNSIPCTGDDWFFTDGISGDFIEKDNTHALAYPTSAPGTNGTLRYRPSNGVAECYSNITVVEPTYACAFIPPSANLKYSQSQSFALNCSVNGTATTPDSTTYYTKDGLQGALSNESNSGVAYTAPDFDTSGKLVGFGQFTSAPFPILGAEAEAPITVLNGTNTNNTNSTNSTNSTCPGCSNPGDSKACQLRGDLSNVFNGFKGLISLTCGRYGNESCTSALWKPTSATVDNPFSTTGSIITIIGDKGESGSIFVIVNGNDEHQSCRRDFIIGDRACWEIS